jgi:hydrogenase maturation factor HypE
MTDIFKQALVDIGFVEEEEGVLSRVDSSGEIQVVNLKTMRLTATLKESKIETRQLIEQKQVSLEQRHKRQQIKEDLKEVLHNKAQHLTTEHSESLQQKIAKQLAEQTPQRNELMHAALQKTYAEALKKKAQMLGQVIELSEETSETGQYELNITIEL